MPAIVALPISDLYRGIDSKNITFVLPAKRCDLACPACYIAARNEAGDTAMNLSVDDFLKLVDAGLAIYPDARFAIQGYEPLLPETWPYTEAILERLQDATVVRGLITNGTNLAERAVRLGELQPSLLTVSLDSHRPELHDLTRGVQGAFFRTVSGLRAALKNDKLNERIMVASMLQPRRHHYLEGMASWLAARGVHTWVVAPVINPRKGEYVEDRHEIAMAVLKLQVDATACGIELVFDDEFSSLRLEEICPREHLPRKIRQIECLESTVRISPTGQASIGNEIFVPAHDALPRWDVSTEDANDFLRRVMP